MSTILNGASAVNPARLTACPRCEGRGTVTFTRPGGWLKERCNVCGTTGLVDPETAETVRVLQRHAEAALGPVDGPCCEPHDSPCVSCVPPDLFPDEPFVPSEADEAWYRGLCREREVRLWEGRIEAGPTFVEVLYERANHYRDMEDETLNWLGNQIAKLADQARFFGATSGESFDDRKAACLDAEKARVEARMAAHAGR